MEYGKTLLKVACEKPRFSEAVLPALTLSESARWLKKRISAVKGFAGSRPRWVQIAPAVLLLGLLVAASGKSAPEGACKGALSGGQMLKKFARALSKGDYEALCGFLEIEDNLDREAARLLSEIAGGGKEGRVELVTRRLLSEDELFACFFIHVGAKEKRGIPLGLYFYREGGRWSCRPLLGLHTFVVARKFTGKKLRRRLWTNTVCRCFFGSGSIRMRLERLKAELEAYRLLSKPPYNVKACRVLSRILQAQVRQLEKFRSAEELRQWVLGRLRVGEELARPEDFYVCFYLEARDGQKAIEIPCAGGGEKIFRAFPVPCLTGDMVCTATSEMRRITGSPAIPLKTTREGAEILRKVTAENLKRRVAVVVEGKVLMAPVIQSPLPGDRIVIVGNLSGEQEREMAQRLNGYRTKALEFLRAFK